MKVSGIDEPCYATKDCNTYAGLSCQTSTCQCEPTKQWNPQTLSCDMCAPNYIKSGLLCGLY